jgi:predicted nucleic acid-binding protein
MDREIVLAWRDRFADDRRVTLVNLGRRDVASRDPDDNVFLSTARSGRAKYLVTNDRDLLDLPAATKKRLPFAVVRPSEFLQRCEL